MEVGRQVASCHGHLLVKVDGISRYVWLEPTTSCSGEVSARKILKLCVHDCSGCLKPSRAVDHRNLLTGF